MEQIYKIHILCGSQKTNMETCKYTSYSY